MPIWWRWDSSCRGPPAARSPSPSAWRAPDCGAGWRPGAVSPLPSALLLLGFAYLATSLTGVAAAGAIHGLSLVAVAVVAQAVWGMARMLTPDARRIAIAVAGAAVVLFFSGAWGQIAAILLGGAAGLLLCRDMFAPAPGRIGFPSRRAGRGGADAVLWRFLPCCRCWQRKSQAMAVFEALLPLRRAGVRRRACRSAAAAWRGGDAGMDFARCIPGRVLARRRRCPGRFLR